MGSRFIHLHLENLESRLVAGSYFGGPTGSGGLANPLFSFLGDAPPRTPGEPATGVYRPGGHAPRPTSNDPPRRGQITAGSTGNSIYNHLHRGGLSLLPPDVPRRADGSAGAAQTLEAGLAGIGGLDPDSAAQAPVRHPFARGELSGTNPGAGAPGSAGEGRGSVAPGSPAAAPAGVPVPVDDGARRLGQDLAVVNARGASDGGTDLPPDRRLMTDGLAIPHHHPRIWWNHRNLAQARDYYARNPFQLTDNDVVGHAVVYALTGDLSAANFAINVLMNFTISESELQSVASDTYRWSGWVPVVFDWVHDAMTPDQIRTFTDRYNYYAFTMMNKPWGGPSMPGNNYFWGYFANEFNWAIATYYDNPMAQTFLDDALITRWQDSFVPWAEGPGRGGVFGEGTEYMMADLDYPSLPLTTAWLLGGDQYGQTNFYKEAIFNEIYSTTPAPTYSRESPANPYYMPFPFGENEHSGGYPNLQTTTAYGDFMQTAAAQYAGLPVGQYAYHWLQMVQPWQTPYTIPAYESTPAFHPEVYTPDFSSLPLDYYAPGAQYFYTRNQWGPQATSVLLQLGQSGESHANLDAGSFQIWRNSWFVTKNTVGYSLQINGGMSEAPIAQNTLLFGGQGIARAWRANEPQVVRLQSADDFAYAAVDMSGAYRSSYAGLDNPYESRAIREFIFIKPLETMVILDRLESNSDVIPAQQVPKTFLLHFPNAPQPDGAQSWVGTSGDQALRLTTLVPNNATYNVVDESDFNGPHDPDPAFYNYRLEESTSGSAQSYFINVLQARDANGRNVTSSVSQNATSWTITLNHPTLGHAQIVLNKGMDSQGGAVGYSATGTPTEFTPLLDHVQDSRVTDYGPVWGS